MPAPTLRLRATVLFVSFLSFLVAGEPLAKERGSSGGKSDASEVVRKLHAARTPAEEAARVLVKEHRQSPEEALRLLASVYSGRATAAAAVKALGMSPDEAAKALRRARVPAEDVSAGFAKARVRNDELARALHRGGYPAEEATGAVLKASRLEGYPTYELLREAGYDTGELRDAVVELGVPVDMDCVGPDGLPAPCGSFGAGGNAPAMGQVTWSPAGSGQTGSEVVFESTNIPPVDVLFDGDELTVLERTPSRVRAKLPPSPGTGALALRRQSDGVVGVIEDPYQVVPIPPPDPLDTVDWAAAADAAFEGAMEDADAWIMASRFDASRCTVNAAIATAKPGVLRNPSGFEGAVEERLLEAGAPPKLAEAWQAAFEEAFLEWAEGVMIPNLPWYPALASFPGSQAPPTPNVPTPLVSLVSKEMQAMTPTGLVKRLTARLPDADTPAARTEIAIFAAELSGNFTKFLAQCLVHNVMGEGPVPSFQPGVVPAGPVVDGSCGSSGMWASLLPSGGTITLPDLSDL